MGTSTVAATLAVVVAATATACGGGAGGDRTAFCDGLETLGDQVADGDAAGDPEAVLATVNDLLASAPRGEALVAADEVGDAVERLDPTAPSTVVAFTDVVARELGPPAESVCDLDADLLAEAPAPPEPDPFEDIPLEDLPFDIDDLPFDIEDLPLEDFPFEDLPLEDFPFEDLPFEDLPPDGGQEAPDAPPLGDELARGEAGQGSVTDGGVLEVALVGDGEPAVITVFGDLGFDPTLTVLDADGVEAGFDDDGAGAGFDSRLELTITTGERWTAEIRAYDDLGPGDITITYE